jgi:hypothetical protein
MAKLSKKNHNSNQKALENFIQLCVDYSPFALLAGMVFSFIFCAMIDYAFFSVVFQNIFYGTVAIFCAAFIFIVRSALLFHSFKGFSEGKYSMGAMSALLQFCAVIWVCYEAPKVSLLLTAAYDVQQSASTNFIRFVAVSATLLEFLFILAIKGTKVESEEELEDDDELIIKEKPKHSLNGSGKLMSELN